MKRSEMIDLIHEEISAELRTVIEFDKNDCSRLLNKIEKAGMLPPKYIKTFHLVNGVAYVNCELFEWESENE